MCIHNNNSCKQQILLPNTFLPVIAQTTLSQEAPKLRIKSQLNEKILILSKLASKLIKKTDHTWA